MKETFKPAINKNNWNDKTNSVSLNIEVRPYNMKELCNLYKMSYKSMYTCLKPMQTLIGKKRGYFYTVRQVEIIFRELGIPYSINENN